MEPIIQAILNVLIIIALIAAIAFILILVVDLILSITNRNGSIFFRNKNDEERPVVKPAEEPAQPVVTQEPILLNTWNEQEAQKEQLELLEKQTATLSEQEAELALAKELDEANFKDFDDFDDFDSLFEEDEDFSSDEEIIEEETFDFDELINEINSESVTKYEAIKNEETTKIVEEAEETTEEVEEVVTEQVEEKEEIKEEVKVIANVYEYFPLDALNERLVKLEERLKINEKDLKGNRKEYNPLAKVQRSLNRDQEKLRRREAVVARKKVMLYGVNNYVDIDEEKAKKLNEDLELLEALRLSVQHCEEVMAQNKDRFPILEKTNQILVEQNKQLKEDIAEVKAAIAKLQETTAE